MKTRHEELWVLSCLIDGSDPVWDHCATVVGNEETIRSKFDLSCGVPWGWRLYKGKAARRFLRNALRSEIRFRRDQSAREKAEEN